MKKVIPLILWMLLLFACSGTEKIQEEEAELPVAHPILMNTKLTKEYVCQIHAIKHIELRALERGYLQSIFVDEGQLVKQGQPMFKIMPNVYEAEMQTAKAEAHIAEIEYQNTKTLADNSVVSQNELALAKARLDKANAELSLAETHLNFTNVNAPFTGIMDHLEAREGSLLEEGELLTSLSDNEQMWVYFNVPEAEYLDYMTTKENKSKEVRLKMANGQIFSYPGKIETIEGEFNNETGNIQFRAVFPNPERLLRHGQTGNILIDIPYNDALIIPQKASFEILDKKYVFVINKDQVLEQREIKIAEELPHLYIISSGLSVNDVILLDGLRKVANGQEVKTKLLSSDEELSGLELYAE